MSSVQNPSFVLIFLPRCVYSGVGTAIENKGGLLDGLIASAAPTPVRTAQATQPEATRDGRTIFSEMG